MSLEIDITDIAGAEPKRSINIIEFAKDKLSLAGEDVEQRQDALHQVCSLLASENNIIRRAEHQKEIAKLFKHSPTKIEKFVKEIIAERNAIPDESAPLPSWVDRDKLYADGFVQQFRAERHYNLS